MTKLLLGFLAVVVAGLVYGDLFDGAVEVKFFGVTKPSDAAGFFSIGVKAEMGL